MDYFIDERNILLTNGLFYFGMKIEYLQLIFKVPKDQAFSKS